MRQTFGQLITTTYDYIGHSSGAGSVASSTIANFVKGHLNKRYLQILRSLPGYIVSDAPQTTTTVADQTYYHYPPNAYPPIEAATCTIGSVAYPLRVIHSQREWDRLNQIDFAGTTRPQYIFPRRDDFGIYPTPGASGNTITLITSLLDRAMTADDHTSGTVAVTSNSATITGTGTTFTAAMVGRWFTLTDANGNPSDNWYRIASFTSTTQIALETVWEGSSASGQTYIIGESPEIPPELHELLPHGAAADFFMGPRKNAESAKMHTNYWMYGDPAPNYDQIKNPTGGLKAAIAKYASRDTSAIVYKGGEVVSRFDESWTTTIS